MHALVRGALAAATVTFAPALAAQVGHLPSASPYHDLVYKQELTAYSGYFGGSTGRAGVGPQGGPLVGLRYGILLGGPAEFSVHLARVFSERQVVDPTKSGPARTVGTTSLPLYLSDVGITLNLTGRKSYHYLVPVVGFGLGVASDMGTKRDVGGFRVGTPFALTFGAGIRIVPGKSFGLRLEVADYMYQISYPAAYFSNPSGGGPPVLGADVGTGQWLHNATFTLGISYLFSR